eukprot:TRINITY_DN3407_c0_g1_i2.p1 TRINITY_DN3407_c0_g1~~TRINITY_DN3407_c0_g1_i2.p1  ORF type:complete len:144 (-),score=16.59 TRINITY_DN3407_c0_g1_i2:575-1006(-)
MAIAPAAALLPLNRIKQAAALLDDLCEKYHVPKLDSIMRMSHRQRHSYTCFRSYAGVMLVHLCELYLSRFMGALSADIAAQSFEEYERMDVDPSAYPDFNPVGNLAPALWTVQVERLSAIDGEGGSLHDYFCCERCANVHLVC